MTILVRASLFQLLTPISSHSGQTKPGRGSASGVTGHAHGAMRPEANATKPTAAPATTVVTIQNARTSARRNAMINGEDGLVEGTGILLSVGVDVGNQREGLIFLQQHVVLEHQA